MWLQREILLEARPRGFHLVGAEIEAGLPELAQLEVGLLHLHLRHTSASLALNENASPDVRRDLETWFSAAVAEGPGRWRHADEGPDDMPSHIKAALTSTTLSIPVADGRLALGTWQGIYLWEHRTAPHRRELALHLLGT